MMKKSAKPPLVIHVLVPSMRQPSPLAVARARMAAVSEPASGSVSAYAPSSSPVASRGRYFAFCSSLPNRSSGAAQSPACTATATDRPAS